MAEGFANKYLLKFVPNVPTFRQVTQHTLANHLYGCFIQENRITMAVEASW
jgi:hypothetical protein